MFESPPPSAFSTAVANIKAIAETAGIVIGGVWAYYKFFKGRTFRPRLELVVSGRVRESDGHTNVLISAQLKNVGLSKVGLSQEGTAIRVFSTDPGKPQGAADWERAITISVFENHAWIEPGETISDQALVFVAGIGHKAVKLHLRLAGNGIEWNSFSIIEPEKN